MLVSIFALYKINSFSNFQIVRVRMRLMKCYLSLPYQKYQEKNSAEYVYAINDLARNFSLLVVKPILKMLSDFIISIFLISFLIVSYGPDVLVIAVILGLGMSLYYLIFNKKQMRYGVKTNESADQIIKTINEGMVGFREIRVAGIEQLFLNYLSTFSKRYAFNSNFSQLITQAPRFIIEFLLLLSLMSLTFLYIFIYEQSVELLAALAVIAVASVRLLPAFNSITNTILTLRYQLNTVNRLFGDLKGFEETDGLIYDKKLNHDLNFFSLKMEGVNFSYAGKEQELLKNVTLEINRGEVVGINGSSGSGKTTLVDLALGFLNPSSGKILLNDEEIQLNKTLFAIYIPQEPFIIDATLRENIALGKKENELDYELINEIIKLSKLENLLETLPEGLETKIGQNGARISGGQKQRIILARAMYSKRVVIVLDEATSALDEETEKQVLKNFLTVNKGSTVLLISHRTKLFELCDKVFTLENKSVLEM